MPGGEHTRAAANLGQRAFTLIELLVVLAIVALLLTLAAPRYFQHVETAKEATLRENLQTIRRVLDAFYQDFGRYPESLDELVERHYLRALPLDPITNSSMTWSIESPPDGYEGSVYEVKSGAPGAARDGTYFSEW
jgi:general secretion pathway protein G